ncbi:MAG TPA: metal-dependent hydrolase [Vicinamibacterales bacterium]|nr:metal-dependent hydrolase [Vicinamibacterales bacterium]
MDNLTHSLVGYTLARAGLGRTIPGAAATLVLASNVPDIDIVAAFAGGRVAYLAAHRGVTHGFVTSLALAVLVTVVVLTGLAWWTRRRDEPLVNPRRVILGTYGLAVFGALLHITMDLPTSYGTRVLAPFAGTWYALDWMPIIDVYLWALLLAGLLWSRLRPADVRRSALVVLLLAGVDYGIRAGLHQFALADAAQATADGTVSPCAARPTLVRHPSVIEAAVAGPDSCIRAAALPTFLSPLTWRVIRQYPGGYELSERELFSRERTDRVVWIPSDSGPLIARARATTAGRVFLDFARFPAARIVQTSPDEVVVRIADVRFVGTPIGWDPDARPRGFFVLNVVLDRDGSVLAERLGD